MRNQKFSLSVSFHFHFLDSGYNNDGYNTHFSQPEGMDEEKKETFFTFKILLKAHECLLARKFNCFSI